MEQKKIGLTLAKQGMILAAASLIVRFIGFIYRVPLYRMIGDEGMGYYSAAFQIYTFFFILSSSGIPIAVSKMVSERNAVKQYTNGYKVFKAALTLCVIFGSISMFILWFGAKGISNWLDPAGELKVSYSLRALAPTVLIVSIMSALRGYFQGFNTMVPTAVSQIIEQVFNAIFSIVMAAFLFQQGIEFAAAGGTMGTGIGAFFGLIFLLFLFLIFRPVIKRMVKKEKNTYTPENSKTIYRIILLTTVPIIAGSVITSVTNLIDLAMVKKGLAYLGYEATRATELYGILTGKYVLLTTLPVSLATALGVAVVPSIATSMMRQQVKEVFHKVNQSLRFTLLVTIPSAVGLAVLGEPIIQLLFSEAYSDGAGVLMVGAISVIFFGVVQITTSILQGIGKILIPAKNAAIGAVFKIILNYIFIYLFDWNIYGAVMSTNIFALIVAVLNIRSVINVLGVKIRWRNLLIKPIIGAILMGGYGWVLYQILFWGTKNNSISGILSIGFAVIMYGLFMLAMKGITKEEIKMFPFGERILQRLEKNK